MFESMGLREPLRFFQRNPTLLLTGKSNYIVSFSDMLIHSSEKLPEQSSVKHSSPTLRKLNGAPQPISRSSMALLSVLAW